MAIKAYLESERGSSPSRRRQSRRQLRLETSGVLANGFEANVMVHNISAAGMLLETDVPLNVDETLLIDLPEVGRIEATIVWRSERLYGCGFSEALSAAGLAAAQLRGASGASEPAARGIAEGNGEDAGSAASQAEPLGARINRLRRERGLTLADIAASLGVSKPTVWAWEKGKARPLPERIDAIAAALKVDARELLESAMRDGGATVVQDCRMRIASAYGTSPGSIRIMIEI